MVTIKVRLLLILEALAIVQKVIYKRPAMARRPPATAPIAGALPAAAPGDEVAVAAPDAADRAEEAALEAEFRIEERAALRDDCAPGPVAVAAALLKLARREDTSPAREDWTALAELWAETTRDEAPPAIELAAEPAAEVRDAMALEPPPRADETWPAMEERTSPWALAAPAARKVVAMMEKRILICA